MTVLIGSPPRAWGTRNTLSLNTTVLRFTPTCVGNSITFQRFLSPFPVHPHVRGELDQVSIRVLFEYGSPPRAWGTRSGPRRSPRSVRFTPTCVGNSNGMLRRPPLDSVHPHVRGELASILVTSFAPVGSPPRAWGTRDFEFLFSQ